MPSGEHERRLAIGTILQQISQVFSVVVMLAVITVLARRLTLTEFGTYGLLVSLTAYVFFVQSSIETLGVKAIAEAPGQRERNRAFSTALSVYVVAGGVAAALIAVGGISLLGLLNVPAALQHQARVGVLILAAVTFVGWPAKTFQDVLRASHELAAYSAAEISALLILGSLLMSLALADAPLWALVGVGGSAPLAIGLAAAALVTLRGLPFRFTREGLERDSLRRFLRPSGYLLLGGISDLVLYVLDRAILSAFRSPATLALYEGAVRPHNLLRQLNGTFAIASLPTAASYLRANDRSRLRDLLLRGTRYALATIVPLTLVFMILAQPILEVWLGSEYKAGALAMTILASYWLFHSNTVVAGGMLLAAGRVRQLVAWSVAVAAFNLTLSLALTPWLGLNGLVIGTAVPFAVLFPVYMVIVVSTFPVTLSDFAREAWLPAYATGAVVSCALLVLRFTVVLDTVPKVVGAVVLGLGSYWTIYYAFWLRPHERDLVKNLISAPFAR